MRLFCKGEDGKMGKYIKMTVAVLLAVLMTVVFFGCGITDVLEDADGESGGVAMSNTRVVTIEDDSMYPLFGVGDSILVNVDFKPSELKVGDIISYYTLEDDMNIIETHRIVNIYTSENGESFVFETKGDNNSVSDTFTVQDSAIVGVYMVKFE